MRIPLAKEGEHDLALHFSFLHMSFLQFLLLKTAYSLTILRLLMLSPFSQAKNERPARASESTHGSSTLAQPEAAHVTWRAAFVRSQQCGYSYGSDDDAEELLTSERSAKGKILWSCQPAWRGIKAPWASNNSSNNNADVTIDDDAAPRPPSECNVFLVRKSRRQFFFDRTNVFPSEQKKWAWRSAKVSTLSRTRNQERKGERHGRENVISVSVLHACLEHILFEQKRGHTPHSLTHERARVHPFEARAARFVSFSCVCLPCKRVDCAIRDRLAVEVNFLNGI